MTQFVENAVQTAPTSPPLVDDRARAVEAAADQARLAPSVHNTQPWHLDLQSDRMVIRADRSRQLTVIDPKGRELVESVGAALFNARVALAHGGWGADVERPARPHDPHDPDVLAVIRPVAGAPDGDLAVLAPAVNRRRTNRRRFTDACVPDDVLRRLGHIADTHGVTLIPVVDDDHRRVVARLTQRADGLQNANPAYRAELRHWTNRAPGDRDGVPAAAIPHVDGLQSDDVPLRDFDTHGAGELPAETHSVSGQTMVLLATHTDDQPAWLRAGEAMQHVLLELTRSDWVASPLTQPIEVPLTRTELRAALTWNAHPQMLLRIGRAESTPRTPRRLRADVVTGEISPATSGVPRSREPGSPAHPEVRRPVSDGRGGTTWI